MPEPPPSQPAGRPNMLLEFIRNPIATATIAPSSPELTRAMLVDIDPAQISRMVEYGPGTGVFTRAAIAKMGARLDPASGDNARFDIIELNERLAGSLAIELKPMAPAVTVHHRSADEVEQIVEPSSVDLIISGLGWPSLPGSVRDSILEQTARVLKPGGEFRTFGYHIGLCFPGAWAFRKTCRRLFTSVTISPVIWKNLPPAFVYRCTR